MSRILLRSATTHDLPAINAIYNHYVLNSACTYQTEPESQQARELWFSNHGSMHPVNVAEMNQQIVGWGSLSKFRERMAYDRTVENSIYVHPDHLRKGIGAMLLADQINSARRLGHHTIIAGIDAEQPASIALHARFHFKTVGDFREVGFKFDRWLHVIFMQRML